MPDVIYARKSHPFWYENPDNERNDESQYTRTQAIVELLEGMKVEIDKTDTQIAVYGDVCKNLLIDQAIQAIKDMK